MERSQIIDIKQFNTFYDINYHSIDRLIQFGQIKHIKKNTLIIEEKQKMKIYFSYFKVLLIIIAFLKMIVKEYSILKIKNIF